MYLLYTLGFQSHLYISRFTSGIAISHSIIDWLAPKHYETKRSTSKPEFEPTPQLVLNIKRRICYPRSYYADEVQPNDSVSSLNNVASYF